MLAPSTFSIICAKSKSNNTQPQNQKQVVALAPNISVAVSFVTLFFEHLHLLFRSTNSFLEQKWLFRTKKNFLEENVFKITILENMPKILTRLWQ